MEATFTSFVKKSDCVAQVKQSMIITNKHGIYKLLKDLGLGKNKKPAEKKKRKFSHNVLFHMKTSFSLIFCPWL